MTSKHSFQGRDAALRRQAGAARRPYHQVSRILLLLYFSFQASTLSFRVSGQSYSIDWSKIAAGEGTSTNRQYSISGTIGQPDAGGPMTNGQYSVTGGFWALPQAVQTVGAPTLTIAPATPGFATISWTPNTPGFVLQET
jgi:hypothetical protein